MTEEEKAAAEAAAAKEAAEKLEAERKELEARAAAGKDTVSKEWHDRVKRELEDAQAKLREREKADAAAEKQRLEEQGKFKEIADKEKAEREKIASERDALRQDYAKRLILREVKAVAAAAGLESLSDAKFVDLTGVEYDADKDEVVGVAEAVERFKASHPRFFKPDSIDEKNPKKPSSFIPPGPTTGKPGEKDAFSMSKEEYESEFRRRFPSVV